jgi:hypothetical protein
MQLTEEQKEELARVLATHLVGFATRRATAEEAGMPDAQVAGDPEQSWSLLIEEALEKGRLRHLLAAAALQSPGDTVLELISESAERGEIEIPEEPEVWSIPWRTLGIGAVGTIFIVLVIILGVRLIAWLPSGEEEELPPIEGEPPQVQLREGLMAPGDAEPQPEPVMVEPVEGADDTEGEAGDPESDTEPQVLGRKYIKIPDPEPPPPDEVPDEPPSVAPSPTAVPSTGGCKGPAGQVVGYAYAGSATPSITGGRWSVAQDVNVRAWYPTAENSYDTTGPVVCVLTSGSTVAAGDPISVAGGAFWVPVKGTE